ncbi:MAG: calcineurin-like phosphoesterase family protein [Bacteroidales bacterium]|nr:calcineurin-like phosphoesterase family protein [Bacteroidales bacterium]
MKLKHILLAAATLLAANAMAKVAVIGDESGRNLQWPDWLQGGEIEFFCQEGASIDQLTIPTGDYDAYYYFGGTYDALRLTPERYKELMIEAQQTTGKQWVINQMATPGWLAAFYSLDEPPMGIAMAQLELCTSDGKFVLNNVPMYTVDYETNMVTPHPSAATRLSVGCSAATAYAPTPMLPAVPSTITAEDTQVTLQFPSGYTLGIDTLSVVKAPDYGLSILRGEGSDLRRLNITDIALDANKLTIITREALSSGDRILYGSLSPTTGRLDGMRGNLTALQQAVPLFEVEIEGVAYPSANVTGTITCEGEPVAGVMVSDGYAVATTGSDGRYALRSNKRMGYVFYTLPAGYEPETEENGWQVKIYSLLESDDTSVAETHDFRLTKVDNDDHIMLVGADSHLANRNSDLSQFKKGFVKRVKAFAKANTDTKVYSTILGDLTWDQYWTSKSYGLPEFVETMTSDGYPLMLFPVIGNHDNDPSIEPGNDTDHRASGKFREYISPTYYSFNLGKIHYVVLDDIVYTNTAVAGTDYGEGIAGSRDYGQYYTNEQLEWLRQDLAAVTDLNTPIVVMAHIQNWALSTDGTFRVSAALTSSTSDALAKLLAPYAEAHILTGHTHYNYHAHPDKWPNLHENNVAAICATWWWTGKLTDRHICKDGSPGGFATYTASGRDLSWKYHSIEDDTDPQMRVYDMNTVKEAYKSDADVLALMAAYPSRVNYATIGDNLIYVNVFNYDIDWTVEILEGDTPLTVKRIVNEDPLHTLAYDVARYKAAGTLTSSFTTNKTNHMFSAQASTADTEVTVRVTDSFGRVYTTTLSRPIPYNINM